jgi:pilus assembly protein CpaB
MKVGRLLIALAIALALSGLLTFWLSRRLGAAARVVVPQKQRYVAVSRALEAGQVLRPEDVQLIDWPVSAPIAGGFTRVEEVTGRAVLYPLPKGQPITGSQLAVAGAGVGLTANIPSGMRAISVRSDEVVGVAGFLLPGTHVDVLMTYHAGNGPEPQTVTVLQNAIVLAAGQQSHPEPDGKPISVNVVTLLLTPQDAEKLVLSSSLGAIHFVLRNGADTQQSPSEPIGLNQLAGIAAPGPRQAARSIPRQAAKSSHYQVETILGDKSVVSNFN